jgi:hypothetical protein
MVAAGTSPHVIAEQLGHRDARLVLQRYGHLYPGASRQAALDLDLYLEDASVWAIRGAEVGPVMSLPKKALEIEVGGTCQCANHVIRADPLRVE